MTILSLKDKNDDLVIVPGDLTVIACRWGDGAIPTAITSTAAGTLMPLPAGWFSAGEIDKKAGADITPDSQTAPIEGYGSMVPRRVVKTSESVTLDFTAQESRKVNFGMFWGMDLSSATADATTGEWQVKKTAQSNVEYFSVILIAQDGAAGNEIYPYWIFPKMSVTKSGKIGFQVDGALSMPISLTAYEDPAFGGYVAFGQAGKGNQALNGAAGFLPPATSITVAPATKTLAVAATQQLTVTDNNGTDVTSQVTYSTSAAAKATVSASGLITGVATGSATITATLGSLTGTCAVTVS